MSLVRTGSCCRCGICCDFACPNFFIIANEDIPAGTITTQMGIGRPLMAGCTLDTLPDPQAAKAALGMGCDTFPSDPTQIRGYCSYAFIEEEQ